MVWATTVNSYSGDDSLTVNKGREITLNDGNTYQFDLPDDDVAIDDQEYYLIVNISNDSKLEIRTLTSRPDGDQSIIRTVINSVAIHFLFDGTNNKWRIISDDKVRSIEDEDHPLAALSGNSIKDQDGNLIQQSGVEVVGITSINGKTPLLAGDDIVVGTLDSGRSTISGLTVENYGLVNGGLTVTGAIAVGGIASINGGSPIIKHVVDNTVSGSFYDAIDSHYGLPSEGEVKPIDIRMMYISNGYYYIRQLLSLYKKDGYYYTQGYVISTQTGSVAAFNGMFNSSAGGNWCDTMYVYV